VEHIRYVRYWMGEGRWLVFLVIVPLACIIPWGVLTDPSMRVVGYVGIRYETFQTYGLTTAIAAAEYANRLTMVAATTLLILVSSAATFFAVMVAYRSSTMSADRRLHFFVGIVLAATLLPFLVSSRSHIYDWLGAGVFSQTLGAQGDKNGLIALLNFKLCVANIAVLLAATALAIAAASIATAASRIKAVEQLRRHDRLNRNLDNILLACAAVLGAGLIEVKQWYGWPLPFIDSTDQKAFTAICNAFIGLESVCFVGVLAGIYFPAGYALDRARSRMGLDLVRAARPARGLSAAELKQATEMLSVKPTGRLEQLMRAVAILSPILVGPLASFVALKLAGN
jgi:hypothetical protein